jgi:hypothetical protein
LQNAFSLSEQSSASGTSSSSQTHVYVAVNLWHFPDTVARLFRAFPAKVAGKFEKILQLNKCRAKLFFQTLCRAKAN